MRKEDFGPWGKCPSIRLNARRQQARTKASAFAGRDLIGTQKLEWQLLNIREQARSDALET